MNVNTFANRAAKTAKEIANYQGVKLGLSLNDRAIVLGSARGYVGKVFNEYGAEVVEQISEAATDILFEHNEIKTNTDAVTLDVNSTLRRAFDYAAQNPYIDLTNSFDVTIGRILNLKGMVSEYKKSVANYDALLELFLDEANVEAINEAREIEREDMANRERDAKEHDINQMADQLQSGLVWSIYENDNTGRGYPYASIKVEDAFNIPVEDGSYPFYISETSWSPLEETVAADGLINTRDKNFPNFTNQYVEGRITIENGELDMFEFDSQIPEEFAEQNSHIFVELFRIEDDGRVRVSLGS